MLPWPRYAGSEKLDKQQVIKSFYAFDSSQRLSFSELEAYPIELLTEYLKHAHHLFIKDRLPYIVHLARKRSGNHELQDLLPEFIEDLIRHIYEEEDTTFKYIQLLAMIRQNKEKAPISRLMEFADLSLEREYAHHKEEDELGAIRSLMGTLPQDCLHSKVLIHELRAFDREMIYHAAIENTIFFPKALQLEVEVKEQLDLLSTLN